MATPLYLLQTNAERFNLDSLAGQESFYMPEINLVSCLGVSSRTFVSFLKYGEARDNPTSSLGHRSPLHRRLMTLGEQVEIVCLISPMVELAIEAELLA